MGWSEEARQAAAKARHFRAGPRRAVRRVKRTAGAPSRAAHRAATAPLNPHGTVKGHGIDIKVSGAQQGLKGAARRGAARVIQRRVAPFSTEYFNRIAQDVNDANDPSVLNRLAETTDRDLAHAASSDALKAARKHASKAKHRHAAIKLALALQHPAADRAPKGQVRKRRSDTEPKQSHNPRASTRSKRRRR